MEKLSENEQNKFEQYLKTAWIKYILIVIVLIVALVLLAAEDNEERLFFTLMTAAAAYVFRPSETYFMRKFKKSMPPADEQDDK